MRISVVLDCHDPKSLVEFWSTAMGYRPAGSVAQFEILAPVEGEPPGPALILQQVEKLGGRRVGEPVTELLDEIGVWWQLMLDPEGNEFDLVADPGHPVP